MKRLVLILLVSAFMHTAFAQEFACRVTVSAQNLQGPGASVIDKAIFKTFEQNLTSFINERKWTNYAYKPEEKIDCSIHIELEKAPGNDMYEGKLYAQLSRPVFNSTYYSPVFTFQDNFIAFRYMPGQTFEFDENSFIWTVTSLAAYYANLFLGLIYDTYGLNAGTPFYNKCMNIVNTASSNEVGWSNSSKERRNRYWLLESFTNPANENVRTFLYVFHRQGLDIMAENLNDGLNYITSAIESLQQLYIKNPGLLSVSLICMAKSAEFINIYSDASVEHRQKVVPMLKQMDPVNADKYNQLLQK